jgi:hypothetical protein
VREADAALLAVAVRVAEIEPPADADGFTNVVQLAPFASLVEPLLQVPLPSNPKFVVLDKDSATTEDV